MVLYPNQFFDNFVNHTVMNIKDCLLTALGSVHISDNRPTLVWTMFVE
jgi:hypothetical protein